MQLGEKKCNYITENITSQRGVGKKMVYSRKWTVDVNSNTKNEVPLNYFYPLARNAPKIFLYNYFGIL